MKIDNVTLPANWQASEKGNTMVCQYGSNTATWIHIKDNVYLEITDNPDNSPRLYMTFIEATKAELRKSIRENCEGWYCIRWSLSKKAPINKAGYIK